MPRVTRSRVLATTREAAWALVSDPHNLPRWWPRTARVEDVRAMPGGRRSQWTAVLQTKAGSAVRADFRCISAAEGERYVWEQELEGTPFERVLKSSQLEIRLRPVDGRTEVRLESREALRGLSRLGGAMVRRASRRRLQEALDAIELALTGGGVEAR